MYKNYSVNSSFKNLNNIKRELQSNENLMWK